MVADCTFWVLLFLPACITIVVVRALVFQWASGPRWLARTGLILGAACLIWTALAGLALWARRTCANPSDPPIDLCAAPIEFLTFPIVLNAVFVFLYTVVSFFWSLHEASHNLWFRR